MEKENVRYNGLGKPFIFWDDAESMEAIIGKSEADGPVNIL